MPYSSFELNWHFAWQAREDKKVCSTLLGKLKGQGQLVNLGVDGRIILRMILKKYDPRM
jgi:hypothetical protein